MNKKIAALIGAVGLAGALAVPAIAQAAPQHTQVTGVKAVPLITGINWSDVLDGEFMSGSGTMTVTQDVQDAVTIAAATSCQSGGWCVHKTTYGCLQMVASGHSYMDVESAPCATSPIPARQLWFIKGYNYGGGDSGDNWQNEYGSAYLQCQSAITTEGDGFVLEGDCPDGSGGGFGRGQLWNGD